MFFGVSVYLSIHTPLHIVHMSAIRKCTYTHRLDPPMLYMFTYFCPSFCILCYPILPMYVCMFVCLCTSGCSFSSYWLIDMCLRIQLTIGNNWTTKPRLNGLTGSGSSSSFFERFGFISLKPRFKQFNGFMVFNFYFKEPFHF